MRGLARVLKRPLTRHGLGATRLPTTQPELARLGFARAAAHSMHSPGPIPLRCHTVSTEIREAGGRKKGRRMPRAEGRRRAAPPQAHSAFFDHLVELVPARHYHDLDADRVPTKYLKKADREAAQAFFRKQGKQVPLQLRLLALLKCLSVVSHPFSTHKWRQLALAAKLVLMPSQSLGCCPASR